MEETKKRQRVGLRQRHAKQNRTYGGVDEDRFTLMCLNYLVTSIGTGISRNCSTTEEVKIK